MLANSRLAFISILGGIAAGPGRRARSCGSAHAPWVLRIGVGDLRARDARGVRPPARREGRAGRDRRTTARPCTRRSILAAGTAMGLLRGAVGLLHVLRRVRAKSSGEPAWMYGARADDERGRHRDRDRARPAACAAAPGRSGSSRARSWCPSIPLVFAARSVRAGRARRCRGRAIAAASASGRLAFDSLLATRRRRRGAGPRVRALRDALPARVGARRRARRRLPRRRPAAASSSSRSCCCSPGSRTSVRSGARPGRTAAAKSGPDAAEPPE